MIFRPFSLPCAPAVRPASPCQGPSRCANVVILRGERRNSGKLNAPSAFRSCKLVPTPFPSPRVSAEFILSLGPPRSANAVILRGERRSSGELNAPVRFGLISLLRRCLLARHLMPAYVLSIVSGYHPDVYFCSVRESSGSRLFFFIFRRLTIGSHVVHCPACHAVINYVPFKEHKILFILHFCRIFAATFASGGYLSPVPTGRAGVS